MMIRVMSREARYFDVGDGLIRSRDIGSLELGGRAWIYFRFGYNWRHAFHRGCK